MKIRWLAVLAAAFLAAPAFAQDGGESEQKRKALEKVNNLRVSLDFTNTGLEDVLGYIRDFSGLNLHLDNEVRAKLGDDQLKVTIKVKDLLLKSALKLILSGKDLAATYKEGVILITSKDKAGSSLTTQVHDVRDMLFKIADFPGPRVELTSPSGGSPLTGATFALDEGSSGPLTEDFITELVKTNTGDRSWEDVSGASITLANGLLVVSQSKKVQEEIRRLLDMLRQFK